MNRDEITALKSNAKLDVRLPDQLKDEFLQRCREEGVSSGAVIRSLIIDYLKARPRPVLVRLGVLKEWLMKRSRWIAGGAVGAVTAGFAAMSVLFAPMAAAEDVEVGFTLEFARAAETASITGDYQIALGEPMMLFMQDHPVEGDYGFVVRVDRCEEDARGETQVLLQVSGCELIWRIEIFEAVEWHENELGGVSVTQKRIIGAPELASAPGRSVSFEIGAALEDGAPIEVISGHFHVHS